MIPRFFVDKLRQVHVPAVVRRYVELDRDSMGSCPFHAEEKNSRSLQVDPERYECEVCGAKGDALTFLTQHLQLDFVDAVRELAAQMGVAVPESTDDASPAEASGASSMEQPRQILSRSEVLTRAASHYCTALRSAGEAIAFLQEYGFAGSTARSFLMGFADGRQHLARAFENYDDPAIREAGLVQQAPDGSLHDVLTDRIVFPVRNLAGAIVGLAGWLREGTTGALVLSREYDEFQPTSIPYGLFEARHAIWEMGHAVFTEGGCLDAAALAQIGIRNVVCSLTGHVTSQQLETVLQFTEHITLLTNSPGTGQVPLAQQVGSFPPELRSRLRVATLAPGARPAYGIPTGLAKRARAALANQETADGQSSGIGASGPAPPQQSLWEKRTPAATTRKEVGHEGARS